MKKSLLTAILFVLFIGLTIVWLPIDLAQSQVLEAPANQGAVIVVDDTGDIVTPSDGRCTLREAILNANGDTDVTNGDCLAGSGGDTVVLPAGTYTLTVPGAGEDAAATGDLDITDHMTLTGAMSNTTIIDAAGLDRVLHIPTVVQVTVQQVTLSGGLADFGGGSHSQGDLILRDSTLINNEANDSGGGLYLIDGTTLIQNSLILSNTVQDAHGGGIYHLDGELVIEDSRIGYNVLNVVVLGMGGGIFNQGTMTATHIIVHDNLVVSGNGGGIFSNGPTSLMDSWILNNTAFHLGGGLYSWNGGDTLLANTVISGNTVWDAGGGIWNYGSLELQGNSINNNLAANNGGGIFNWDSSPLAIADSSFYGNVSWLTGGGIYNHDSLATISGSVFQANSTYYAGGGIMNNGLLWVSDILLESNMADGDGAGIANGNWISITNSLFLSNTVTGTSNGGGLANQSGTVVMADTDFIGNRAPVGAGGGIYSFYGTFTMRRGQVLNNSAANGGGMEMFFTTSLLEELTIQGNSAGSGGGIRGQGSGGVTPIRIDNTLIANNIAVWYGGGIDNSTGMVILRNSTVTGNSSTMDTGGGGGIYNGDTLDMTYTTVSGNDSLMGSGGGINSAGTVVMGNSIIANNITMSTGPDCWGAVTSTGYNLFEDANGCTISGDTTGNILWLDPMLGPLQDNGGSNETLALLTGSPAIDQIPDGSYGCAAGVTDDQRYFVRAGGVGQGGTTCDMGAYESEAGPLWGTITGQILLQGRANYSGAVMTAWVGGAAVDTAVTNAAGAYSLSVPTGIYTVTAEMSLYLDSLQIGVVATNGNTTLLTPLLLLAGDTNDDDIIDILDLSLIGGQYAATCPGYDPRADLNIDCVVSILDLSVTGGNFGRVSPVGW